MPVDPTHTPESRPDPAQQTSQHTSGQAPRAMRQAVRGVQAGELMRMCRQVDAALDGKKNTPGRCIRIRQNRLALFVAGRWGPLQLETYLPVQHYEYGGSLAVGSHALVRQLRRLPRDYHVRLDTDDDTLVVKCGRNSLDGIPLTPREQCPPLITAAAEIVDTPDVYSASDCAELAAVLDLRPPKRKAAHGVPIATITVTPTRLRLAGGQIELVIQHARHSSLASGTERLELPATMRMLVATARAFVAANGEVDVTTLFGPEKFVRCTFGRTMLTVQTTGAAVDEALKLASTIPYDQDFDEAEDD